MGNEISTCDHDGAPRRLFPCHGQARPFPCDGDHRGEAGQKAKERVEACTEEAVVGKVYSGLVRRIAAFGAFLEIIPGTDGMLHISEIDHTHVKRVEDYMKLGDRLDVKVLSMDNEGKIRLSRKALLGADGDKGSEN